MIIPVMWCVVLLFVVEPGAFDRGERTDATAYVENEAPGTMGNCERLAIEMAQADAIWFCQWEKI